MILVEFKTASDKTIAFASNGVLSLKQHHEIAFSKINKQQAFDLATAIMQWSSEQPDDSQKTRPYYGDDPECVPGN